METEEAKVVEETKKVDFRKINFEDIEGNLHPEDMSKQLGNFIYSSSKDIGEAELARTIYKEGEVELKKSDVEIIKKYTKDFNYVPRTSIEKAIEF